MEEHASAPSYKRHRFPPAIIGHAVWLYFRFALSYRDVEALLAERGAFLTDETVRQWCRYQLRRCRPRPGDTWHLAAVFIASNGMPHFLWRAVDQDGHVRAILGKCQNSGRATMTVVIFPTWWTIAPKCRRSAAHEGTTNRREPHFSSDWPDFLRRCTAF